MREPHTLEQYQNALFRIFEANEAEDCGLFTALKNYCSVETFNEIIDCYREAAEAHFEDNSDDVMKFFEEL